MPIHVINPSTSGGGGGGAYPPTSGGGGGGGSSGGGGGGGQITRSTGSNQAQSTSTQQSSTYIPEYSQTPILNEIAQYSRSMAPQVYQWGMEQFSKNQGNIDAMMRNALSYGSAPRVASEMGKAQAGVMQGAEAGRQNAIRDLQSYGIDPSSGRYAALDKANQVMAGAQAAGAGNLQRDAVQKTAGDMQNQAMGMSLQNVQTGYGASNAMNQLLGTGMQLKYSPLGTTSTGSTVSSSSGNTSSSGAPAVYNPFGSGGAGSWSSPGFAEGGDVELTGYADETDDPTSGGFVSHELSPSNGSQVDDVDARLNAGEFVVPRDVSEWLGQEYFYKLMAKARKDRTMLSAGDETQQGTGMGYGAS